MHSALKVRLPEGGWIIADLGLQASLLEYAKTYGAKLSKVQTPETPLSNKEVLLLLNTPDEVPNQEPSGEQEELLYQPPTPEEDNNTGRTVIDRANYADYRTQARQIQDWIRTELVSGNRVSLAKTLEWASTKEINLSKGGFSRHLQRTLDNAVDEGYTKVKSGKEYSIIR